MNSKPMPELPPLGSDARLYKYTTAAVADLFLQGSVRLNNLKSYRDIEAFGEAIGDKEEAAFTTRVDNEILTGDAHGVILAHGATTFSGCRFGWGSRNTYVLCLSLVRSCALLERMNMDNLAAGFDEYDTCLEIFDTDRFERILVNHCQALHRLLLRDRGACVYEKKELEGSAALRVKKKHGAYF